MLCLIGLMRVCRSIRCCWIRRVCRGVMLIMNVVGDCLLCEWW